jgi:putative hydroxymethylpyrimidine transport system permease protein
MNAIRPLITLAVFIAAWAALAGSQIVPPYMLPSPRAVGAALLTDHAVLLNDTLTTLAEILIGLAIGTLFGAAAALAITAAPALQRWLLPLLVASQAIPVFALAPLLVLWLGFGLASKIAMASLIIFFPVTASLNDGLRRTPPAWSDLAATMNANPGATLRHIRLPAALPALASGLRIATAIAPIGAVIGEWVGASSGLGYEMLYANARIQPDLMFAALAILTALALSLYSLVDNTLRRLVYWENGGGASGS